MIKCLDYKLCYIDNVDDWNVFKLYFTNDLENQWGDDWDDRPANCNAEPPYTDKTDIFTMYIELVAAGDITFGGKTYSVEDMNKRKACWLIYENIYFEGGDTLEDIINKIDNYNKAKDSQDIEIYTKLDRRDN